MKIEKFTKEATRNNPDLLNLNKDILGRLLLYLYCQRRGDVGYIASQGSTYPEIIFRGLTWSYYGESWSTALGRPSKPAREE